MSIIKISVICVPFLFPLESGKKKGKDKMKHKSSKSKTISRLLSEQAHSSSLMINQRGDPIGEHTYRQLLSLPRQMRRFLQRQFGMSLARVALLLALSGTPISSVVQAGHLLERAPDERAPAAGITVDGTNCTLIEAIESANNDNAAGNGCTDGSGADTITLQSDVTLTAENNNTDGPNGLPSITSQITIEGAGHTVQRSNASGTPNFRIFHVASSGDLTLNNTIVTGGSSGDNKGGAIYNNGTMTVSNSTTSGND